MQMSRHTNQPSNKSAVTQINGEFAAHERAAIDRDMANDSTLNLTADEVLATTRAVRKRLDFDRPVPRSLVEECIDLAFQAPTGSNRQGWHFMIVGDPDKKQAIADLYGKNFDPYVNAPKPNYGEGDTRTERASSVTDSATYLRQNMHRSPYLVIPVIEGRVPETMPVASQAGLWGSLLPAFWSFMLAARARGLGTAWTTLHLPSEREAADILGIPFDKYTQGGLTPLAYSIGTDFKAAPRLDSSKLTHWDTW
jgi:nitroreductase